jgi:16S rRNA (guanine527-N7)-methyltransferase
MTDTPPETIDLPESQTLQEELLRHDIHLEPDCIETLDAYRQALWTWNESINLTRHTTLEKFVTRDIIDSLELAKQLPRGSRVLDVGTGGGVPGLVIAICRPDLRVSVCESTQKKARVVQDIVEQLQLKAEVHACRAEELLGLRTFDTLIARAVAPLRKLLFWFKPHWSAFDQLLLIKGRSWTDERHEAREAGMLQGLELRNIASYSTPGMDAESVLLRVWQKGSDGDGDADLA